MKSWTCLREKRQLRAFEAIIYDCQSKHALHDGKSTARRPVPSQVCNLQCRKAIEGERLTSVCGPPAYSSALPLGHSLGFSHCGLYGALVPWARHRGWLFDYAQKWHHPGWRWCFVVGDETCTHADETHSRRRTGHLREAPPFDQLTVTWS